jgi:peroxiredoxin
MRNVGVALGFGLALLYGLQMTACAQADKKPDEQTPPATVETDTSHAQVKAADFALSDLDGKVVKLSDYRGRVVILDFWATWCPPCVAEIPHLNELAAKYGEKGLTVIGVSVDRKGKTAVEEFKVKSPINYTVALFTPEVYDTYQSYLSPEERGGIPFAFIIDREGIIQQHFVGYKPMEIFTEAIAPLLKTEP